jgi:hypothetical protein
MPASGRMGAIRRGSEVRQACPSTTLRAPTSCGTKHVRHISVHTSIPDGRPPGRYSSQQVQGGEPTTADGDQAPGRHCCGHSEVQS